MLNIIKNDWYRMMERKAYLLLAVLLTGAAVLIAGYLTNQTQSRGNLAVVGAEEEIACPGVQVTCMDREPADSQLIQGRYDAVAVRDASGRYAVRSMRGEKFTTSLEALLNQTDTAEEQKTETAARGKGSTMAGYMVMFLLMQGVMYGRLYGEDKEKHLTERIVTSSLSFGRYLAGHGIFLWLLVFLPSYGILVVLKAVGVGIGFTLPEYAFLIAVLSLLSAAFSLFVNSLNVAVDTANMLGSAILVLTSLLAGTFYSLTEKKTLGDWLLHLLPQKDFMNFAEAMETGQIQAGQVLQLAYVIGLSIAFLGIAVYGLGRRFKVGS